MAQATDKTTILRRAALLGAGAVLALPGVAAPAGASPGTDADLIAACAEFNVLERQFLALFDGPGRIEDDDEREEPVARIHEAQKPILDRIVRLRATTMNGFLARIRTIMLEDLDLNPNKMAASQFMNEQLLGAFLRDFADLAGVARI